MSDEIEWLASHTKFDRETLEGFEDDHLETLRASVDHDDCQCNDADGDAQATNDGDDDADDGTVPDALQEELESLRSEVESLREQRNAEQKERAEQEADRIVTHAEQFEDTDEVFEALGEDPETLAMLADEFEQQAASAAADFGGRVGANDSPGSDDDTDEYLALAKQANPTRFGEPEAGD